MKKKTIRVIVVALFVLVAAVGLIPLSALVYPDISTLNSKNPYTTAFMQHRMGEWREKGIVNRSIRYYWTPLAAVSTYAIKAVTIAEDDKFWSHEGFDYEAMEYAFERNLKARKIKAGGSTITQQLVKNLYLSPSKNPARKIREAILTWRMERNLSKKRILELYLNVAEWGDGIFGIEAAARHYFGTHASSLGPMEAARLAAVLPNPMRYNAKGPSRYVSRRAGRIYDIMVKRGIVIRENREAETDNES